MGMDSKRFVTGESQARLGGEHAWYAHIGGISSNWPAAADVPTSPRGRPLRLRRPAKGERHRPWVADVRQPDEEIMVNEPAATSIEA
jgi:hypothetical protein